LLPFGDLGAPRYTEGGEAYAVEVKLSLVTLLVLAIVGLGLVAGEPEPLLALSDESALELAALEDAFAVGHDDRALASKLAAEYLRLGQPALTLGVLAQLSPGLARDPVLTHRRAQGYEALGRLHDALATAQLARVRCEQSVGRSSSPVRSGGAEFTCTAGELVALEQHEDALAQMLRWGVDDPRNDSRARVAHRLAARRARIASAQLY
jgi:hypothetical protein